MQIKISRRINAGEAQFEVDEKQPKDAIAQALFYLEPDKCLYKKEGGYCLGEDILWQANKATTEDGTYTYLKRRCRRCGATSTAGEYKTGGYYWKAWEVYTKPQESPARHIPKSLEEEQKTRAEGENSFNDIPF